MHYLIDKNVRVDPSVNLALEEYCLKHLDTRYAYFLLYVNQPSVIVGRNQNILQEIDGRFIDAQGMQVVRRMSGGGAVYHDRGNLNFSFIQNPGNSGSVNSQPFLAPVLKALQDMGVSANIDGRNDLLVGTKKISGSARFSNTRRVLVHGTLLFNADLPALVQALAAPAARLLTKAIKSVHRPVANIRPLIDPSMDLVSFKKLLLALISREIGKLHELSLDDRHWQRIYRLAADKYRSWDWTYGRTPDFSVIKNGRGKDRLRIDVHRGKIAGIADLDPNSSNGLRRKLEKRLTGIRYERNEILKALDGLRIVDGNRLLGAEQLANDIYFH